MDVKREPAPIMKIARTSVTEQVYQVLVDKITSGEWKAGEKIPSEIELSEKLGVSRVSLKMALQKLSLLGLVETRVGEGSFVCKFDMSNYFSEIFRCNIMSMAPKEFNEFRCLLEFNMMYDVIMNDTLTEEEISKLEGHLSNMEAALKSKEVERYHQCHFQFHETICELCRNELFTQLYMAVNTIFFEIYKRNSERTWDTLGENESISFHRRTLDALKNRDLVSCLQLQSSIINSKTLI